MYVFAHIELILLMPPTTDSLIDVELGPPKIELLMNTQSRTVPYTMTLSSTTSITSVVLI